MDVDQVIICPILSEKTTALKERKVFCFNVRLAANKIEIIAAIKHHFGIDALKCRTLITKPKPKRVRNIAGKTKRIKKAYVYLKASDTIPIFEGM